MYPVAVALSTGSTALISSKEGILQLFPGFAVREISMGLGLVCFRCKLFDKARIIVGPGGYGESGKNYFAIVLTM